jgi:hypothetical protein
MIMALEFWFAKLSIFPNYVNCDSALHIIEKKNLMKSLQKIFACYNRPFYR